MITIHYLDSDQALIELCEQIKSYPWIALDTEFMRQDTYFAELCLVQIATPDIIACIDALAIQNLSPLYEILFNPQQLKVVHSGDQDFEIIYHLTGKTPAPVFDTQIAAAMLGLGGQISYAALAKTLCNIELDKTQTRTNWQQRPLESAQLHYAADDVRYLCTLYEQMQLLLHQKNRYNWTLSESEKLSDPKHYKILPEHAWWKMKGLNQLHQDNLIIAQTLASWREHQAIQQNKPRKWILSDASIIEMCLQKPRNLATLSTIKGLSTPFLKHYGKIILEEIDNTLQSAPSNPLNLKPRQLLNSAQKKQLHQLKTWLHKKSESLEIAASLLATSKDLEQFVMGEHNIPLLNSWRYEVAGKEALQLLRLDL